MDTYDVYLERYKGFNILSSVVAQAKSTDDLTQIYSMALKEAKTNGNFWSYKEIYDEGARNKLKLADFDVDWFKKKEKDYEAALAKADNQLKQNLSSKIKPSIQASYVELAKLHSEAGNQKMFDECANHAYDVSKDNLNANFYYKVSRLHQRQFEQVKKIIKDQESNDSFAMSAINNKTAYAHARAIQGIMNIRDGDYILGLHAFLEVSPEVVPDLGIYSSYADIARYIVVLAIIGLNRNEIKSKILTGYPKQLLATNTVASKFIESFLNANYEEFGAGLQRIFSEWKNDRYVKEIWEDVYNNVLSAAITQYLAPIEKVKIETVANSFKIKNEQAEDIVKRLILNKAVSFRIDRLNRTFVAKVVNNLDQAHLIKKASNMVGNYCFEKQNAVLKVGFTALANARHKTKGGFDPTD